VLFRGTSRLFGATLQCIAESGSGATRQTGARVGFAILQPDSRPALTTRHLSFGTSTPDGTLRKLLDAPHVQSLGWQRKIPPRQRIGSACRDFFAEITLAGGRLTGGNI
jgi:hypothetical protein